MYVWGTTEDLDFSLRKLQWYMILLVTVIPMLLYYQLKPHKHCSWSLKSTSSHLRLPSSLAENFKCHCRKASYFLGSLLSTHALSKHSCSLEYMIYRMVSKTKKHAGTGGLPSKNKQTKKPTIHIQIHLSLTQTVRWEWYNESPPLPQVGAHNPGINYSWGTSI